MGQELRERHSYHKVIALVGLFLVILGLGSLGVSAYLRNTSSSVRNNPSGTLTRQLQSVIHVPGLGSGVGPPCFYANQKELAFTLLQRQSNQTMQTVILIPRWCTQSISWSSATTTYQGTHWLSTSSSRGDLNLNTADPISIIVSGKDLTEGIYTGDVIFIQHPEADLPVVVHVTVRVVKDQQQASIKDVVAFAYIHDLTLVAEWPAQLVKDQSANITVSVLSSGSLPDNLALSRQPFTNQWAVVSPLPNVHVPYDNEGPYGAWSGTLLVDAVGPSSPIMSLVAQLRGDAFDISPLITLPQSPYQRIVSFHWSIHAKEAGPQNLSVAVAGIWPPESGGELEMSTFISGGFAVKVNDNTPFLSTVLGQMLSVGTSIGGLVAVFISLSDYIQKRKEAKRKEKELHSASRSPKKTPPQPAKKPKGRNHVGSRRRN